MHAGVEYHASSSVTCMSCTVQCLQEEQQKLFEEKLINSQYLSLRQALHDRLHH